MQAQATVVDGSASVRREDSGGVLDPVRVAKGTSAFIALIFVSSISACDSTGYARAGGIVPVAYVPARPSSETHADPCPPADNVCRTRQDDRKYGYWCSGESIRPQPASVQPSDMTICRRCVDEATEALSRNGAPPPDPLLTQGSPSFLNPLSSCQGRMKGDRAELDKLRAKADTWQPHGYKRAGDGIEALTDADLIALPATAESALQRMNALALDLRGEVPFPDDLRAVALAEIHGFVRQEQACRADDKCITARAAKEFAGAFYAQVVSPMCEADKKREVAETRMAKERANPSGVVDLDLLHTLGEEIQDAQDQIKSGTEAYKAVRHHAWRGWRSECQ